MLRTCDRRLSSSGGPSRRGVPELRVTSLRTDPSSSRQLADARSSARRGERLRRGSESVGADSHGLGRFGPAELDAALVPDAAGFVSIDRAKFRAVFAADIPAEETRILAATQKPIAGAIFGQTLDVAAWKTLPSWYLLTRGDHAIRPDVQKYLADRIRARLTEIESSHVPFLSAPERVVELIEAAARDAAK